MAQERLGSKKCEVNEQHTAHYWELPNFAGDIVLLGH